MLSIRTTVRLLILAIVTVAMAWFVHHYLPDGGFDAIPSSLLPANLLHPDFFSVRTTNSVIRCGRDHGIWKIGEEVRTRADGQHVELIIDTIARTPIRDKVTLRQRKNRDLGLDDYGLVVPRAVISIAGHGGISELRIGADAPYEESVFVMTGDSSDIYITDRVILDILPKASEDLRDRTLFPDYGREIYLIEIRQTGKGIIRIANENGSWHMTAPYDVKASAHAMRAILETIRNATIQKFIWTPAPGNMTTAQLMEIGAPYGLAHDESRLGISIWYKDDRTPSELSFGNPDPDSVNSVYVLSSADNTVSTVDTSVFSAFSMNAESFRDHRIFPFSPEDIISLSFQNEEMTFTLRRNDDLTEWIVSRPSLQPADQDAARDFIMTLLNLEDTTIIPIEPGGDSAKLQGGLRLDVTPVPPKEIIASYISRIPGADDSPPALQIVIPSRRLKHIVPGETLPDHFLTSEGFAPILTKEILRIPGEKISSITRRMRGSEEETIVLGRNKIWSTPKPLPTVADDRTGEALVGLLMNLTAVNVTAVYSADFEKYGLRPPQIEYTITLNDPATPIVILHIGSTQPDGTAYVRIKGKDPVYRVSPEAAQLFSKALTITP